MSGRAATSGIVIVALILAILAFTQQQQAANHEATAIARANAAGTAGVESDIARETAVMQANIQATAQAQAEATRSAAEFTAESAGETAAAALAEGTDQAEMALTAQGAAADLEATTGALAGQLTEAARALATQSRQSTADYALAHASRGTSEAHLMATAEAAQTQVGIIQATATAFVDFEATLLASMTDSAIPTPRAGADQPFPVPELDATYTSSDGTISVSYPNRWIANERGSYIVVSSSRRAVNGFGSVPSGEINILIYSFPAEGLSPVGPEPLLALITDGLSRQVQEQYSLIFSEPEVLQLGGFDAARSMGSARQGDIEVIGFFAGDVYIVAMGACAAGEGAACEPVLIAIAKRIVYNS